MEKEIEKPMILKLKEFEDNIIQLINESNIPSFILKNTIEKILNQLQIIEQQELENAIKLYNENIKEGDKKCKK